MLENLVCVNIHFLFYFFVREHVAYRCFMVNITPWGMLYTQVHYMLYTHNLNFTVRIYIVYTCFIVDKVT